MLALGFRGSPRAFHPRVDKVNNVKVSAALNSYCIFREGSASNQTAAHGAKPTPGRKTQKKLRSWLASPKNRCRRHHHHHHRTNELVRSERQTNKQLANNQNITNLQPKQSKRNSRVASHGVVSCRAAPEGIPRAEGTPQEGWLPLA